MQEWLSQPNEHRAISNRFYQTPQSPHPPHHRGKGTCLERHAELGAVLHEMGIAGPGRNGDPWGDACARRSLPVLTLLPASPNLLTQAHEAQLLLAQFEIELQSSDLCVALLKSLAKALLQAVEDAINAAAQLRLRRTQQRIPRDRCRGVCRAAHHAQVCLA